MIHHVWVDGATWPVDYSTKLEDSAEWVLRYGTPEHREGQRLSVASVLSAYAHLTDPNLSMKDATAALRQARKARRRA